MLKSAVLHPELLSALASAGHGSKVLIADANFPFNTGKHHDAVVVYLNLCPGKLLSTEVLQALADEIPIESAELCATESGGEPPIFNEFRNILPGKELTKRARSNFNDHAKNPECFLVIATGDERPNASILLTIGAVPPHIKQVAASPERQG